MKVLNVHERELPPGAALRSLIDGLSGTEDGLWPWETWPAMRFDRPLGPGAVGGHGPIRYTVEAYENGTRIRFRFTAPKGFKGFHEYRVVPTGDSVVLQHVLQMSLTGMARISWPLLFRPLHDALIEDSLDKSERSVTGEVEEPKSWSVSVRVLRWVGRVLRGSAAPGGQ